MQTAGHHQLALSRAASSVPRCASVSGDNLSFPDPALPVPAPSYTVPTDSPSPDCHILQLPDKSQPVSSCFLERKDRAIGATG